MRPHALLGAATGLVAHFRCGLWGWLANVHSRRGSRACIAAKKKATAFAVKVTGLLAFAPDWEYGGQDSMPIVKDYQRIPTKGWTAIQQIRYLEALQHVSLEDGIPPRADRPGWTPAPPPWKLRGDSGGRKI